jgi:hypothetical protein
MKVNEISVILKTNNSINIAINPINKYAIFIVYLVIIILFLGELYYISLLTNMTDIISAYAFMTVSLCFSYSFLLSTNKTIIVISEDFFILKSYPFPRIWGNSIVFNKTEVIAVFITKETSYDEDNNEINLYCLYLRTHLTRFLNLSFDNYEQALKVKNYILFFWNMENIKVDGEYLPQ